MARPRGQLSLVAFFGDKSHAFEAALESCRSVVRLVDAAGSFRAYRSSQVHATIVGMESLPSEPRHNRNAFVKRGIRAEMDLTTLEPVLRRHLPMSIRIGGFDRNVRTPMSRGRSPYERSFEVHRDSGTLTLIGWPHIRGDFGRRQLADLRGDIARECHIEPKYDDDNDLYMVLGRTWPPAAGELAWRIEPAVRNYLRNNPVDLGLGLEDLSIVNYVEETLDPERTIRFPVTGLPANPEDLRLRTGDGDGR